MVQLLNYNLHNYICVSTNKQMSENAAEMSEWEEVDKGEHPSQKRFVPLYWTMFWYTERQWEKQGWEYSQTGTISLLRRLSGLLGMKIGTILWTCTFMYYRYLPLTYVHYSRRSRKYNKLTWSWLFTVYCQCETMANTVVCLQKWKTTSWWW